MINDPMISGDYEKIFTVNIASFMDFERVKADLIQLQGVEDASFDEEINPHELTVFTNGRIADVVIQEVIAQHGFHASPKTFLIS